MKGNRRSAADGMSGYNLRPLHSQLVAMNGSFASQRIYRIGPGSFENGCAGCKDADSENE